VSGPKKGSGLKVQGELAACDGSLMVREGKWPNRKKGGKVAGTEKSQKNLQDGVQRGGRAKRLKTFNSKSEADNMYKGLVSGRKSCYSLLVP